MKTAAGLGIILFIAVALFLAIWALAWVLGFAINLTDKIVRGWQRRSRETRHDV